MKESKIEGDFARHARRAGCKYYKWVSPGSVGVPDRIVIGPGFVLFLEFKAPGKKATAVQARVLSQLNGLGHPAYCVDSLEAAKQILKEQLARNDLP